MNLAQVRRRSQLILNLLRPTEYGSPEYRHYEEIRLKYVDLAINLVYKR